MRASATAALLSQLTTRVPFPVASEYQWRSSASSRRLPAVSLACFISSR